MFKDLITYTDLLEACPEMFGFGDVTFLREFGPWKKDEHVDTLWFLLEKSTVEEQSFDGTRIKSCLFTLTAKT